MQKFRYLGVHNNGHRVRGRLMARNPLDAERQLMQMHIQPLFVQEQQTPWYAIKVKSVSQQDLITMTFQVEQLLRSGLPLIDVIHDMQSAFVSGYFKDVLAGVYDAMFNGATFSQALALYSEVFDETYVSLVAIGEQTGKLTQILQDIATNLRWQHELSAQAKQLMVYPSIVFSLVLAVVVFLMVFLVPELVSFIQGMGQELGFLTLALMTVSAFLIHDGYLIILCMLLLFMAFKWFMRTSSSFRQRMHQMQLNIPIFGSILFQLKMARMANSMAIMYAAGVSVQQIMHMSAKVVANDYLADHLRFVEKQILDGQNITESFASVTLFPPMILKLIHLGEKTGRLDEALKNISYFYDREAKTLIDKIAPSIEPMVTLVLALLVAWVMLATLGPVYDILGKLN